MAILKAGTRIFRGKTGKAASSSPIEKTSAPNISTVRRGRQFENLAADYLRGKGLELVSRNYRSRTGEIDLIMRDGKTLVFVEVRARGSDRYGGAVESIDFHKQKRLSRTAIHYLQHTREQSACRFDVVAIGRKNGPEIQWIKDAFSSAV